MLAAVAVAVVAAVFACILMTMYYVVESSFALQRLFKMLFEKGTLKGIFCFRINT